MHRLFIALVPPAAIRRQLLDLREGVPGARWQDDAQLHLTIRYIGEVDRRIAEDIAAEMQGLRLLAPTIAVDGVGLFGKRDRPHSLWAGVAPREPLVRMKSSVDASLNRIGIAPDGRAFVPHITLARLSGSAGPVEPWIARNAALRSEPFGPANLVLFESHLGADGSHYEPILRHPLVRPLTP